MLRENVVGDTPLIDTTAYVDPSAIIIGRVTVGPNCYIGPSVVIRSDRFSAEDEKARIEIGSGCGIQDLSVLLLPGPMIRYGQPVSFFAG